MEGHEARGRADDCGDERGGQTRGGARLATRRRRQRGSRVERDGGGEEKKEQGEEEPRQRPHGEMEVRPISEDRICSSPIAKTCGHGFIGWSFWRSCVHGGIRTR